MIILFVIPGNTLLFYNDWSSSALNSSVIRLFEIEVFEPSNEDNYCVLVRECIQNDW